MITVVGGAGYVGSVLCRDLVYRGYQVKVIDRGLFGFDGLNEIKDQIELVVKDQRDIDVADLRGSETVINIGGLSNDPTAEWAKEANQELNGRNVGFLAELAGNAGCDRYIFGSSCSIYDRGVFEQGSLALTEEAYVNPSAAYSSAKLTGERLIAEVKEKYPDLTTVILRKGTLFGLSPRMRYDLVVNTFVRHAMDSGNITAFYMGRMWRPLCSVQDASKAYIAAATAEKDLVDEQIFNVVGFNARISELALEVAEHLRELSIPVQVRGDLGYQSVRSYQISGAKLRKTLGWYPEVSLRDAVHEMALAVKDNQYADFANPKYYNIRWLRTLGEVSAIIKADFKLDPDDLLETLR